MRRKGAAKASAIIGDFGIELDAALNEHLKALRSATDVARRRIVVGLPAPPPPPRAAVSFDDLDFAAEGIPTPEENL